MFFNFLIVFFAFFTLFFGEQAQAYCSRCVKIEEERAKEEAEHHHSAGYYDDAIQLHADTKKEPSILL